MGSHQDKDDGKVQANGPEVRRRRKAMVLTMAALCDRTGITIKTLRRIETKPTHRCMPSALADIARALGCETADLLRPCEAPPKILHTHDEVVRYTLQIVSDAREVLSTCGSRSRDTDYLKAIEEALRVRTTLVHYRVLFGPPLRPELSEHLQRLLVIRDPLDRTLGHQTLCLAVYEDRRRHAEFSICAGDDKAVLVLPSFTSFGHFDTALLLQDHASVTALRHFVADLYNAGRKIESQEDVSALAYLTRATYNG